MSAGSDLQQNLADAWANSEATVKSENGSEHVVTPELVKIESQTVTEHGGLRQSD